MHESCVRENLMLTQGVSEGRVGAASQQKESPPLPPQEWACMFQCPGIEGTLRESEEPRGQIVEAPADSWEVVHLQGGRVLSAQE